MTSEYEALPKYGPRTGFCAGCGTGIAERVVYRQSGEPYDPPQWMEWQCSNCGYKRYTKLHKDSF